MTENVLEVKVNTAFDKIKDSVIALPADYKTILEKILEKRETEFRKFLKKRLSESEKFKMNIIVSKYFDMFKRYPEKVKNIVIIDSHINAEKVQNLSEEFRNPNSTLIIPLNNTYSTDKVSFKFQSHYDFWRVIIIDLIDELSIYYQNLKRDDVQFFFIGDDVVFDYSECCSDYFKRILIPGPDSIVWKDNSVQKLLKI